MESPLALATGGSVRSAAEKTRSAGTDEDTVLLHMTPEELDWIKSHWGDPEINPRTGLPEYSFLTKQFKSFKKHVIPKEVRKPFTWVGQHVIPDEAQHANEYVKKVTSPVFHYIRDKVIRPVTHWMGFGNTWDAVAGVGDQSFGVDTVYDWYKHPNSGGKTAIDAKKAASAIATGYGLNAGGASAVGALANIGNDIAQNQASTPPPPASSKEGYKLDVPLSDLPGYKDPGAIDYFTYGQRPEVEFFKPKANPIASAPPMTEMGALNQVATTSTPAQPIFTPEEGALASANKPPAMTVKADPTMQYDNNGLDDEGPLAWHRGLPDNYQMGFATGKLVRGPGTGRSDDIDAKLSDGEYVMDAETVALLGDGSTDEGARRLDQLRERLRKHKGEALSKGKFSANAMLPEQYMGAK